MGYSGSMKELRDRLKQRFVVTEVENNGFIISDTHTDNALPVEFDRYWASESKAVRERDRFIRSNYLLRMVNETNDGRRCVNWGSALYSVDCGDFDKMLDDNLVPLNASDLRPGDRVATRQTWFGMNAGDVRMLTVHKVTDNGWCGFRVEFTTDDAPAECDDGDLVWVVNPDAPASEYPNGFTCVACGCTEEFPDDMDECDPPNLCVICNAA